MNFVFITMCRLMIVALNTFNKVLKLEFDYTLMVHGLGRMVLGLKMESCVRKKTATVSE